MCKAIQDMIQTGYNQGVEQGIERGIERGIEQNIHAVINICKEFNISLETTISKVMNQFSFSEDKAHDYVLKYWDN